MVKLILSPGAVRDMRRLVDFFKSASSETAPKLGDILMRGLALLREHPLICRKANDSYRELVISHGRSGHPTSRCTAMTST